MKIVYLHMHEIFILEIHSKCMLFISWWHDQNVKAFKLNGIQTFYGLEMQEM
jgi:hypothetical protein